MKILLMDGGHVNTLGILRHLKDHEIFLLHHKKSFPAYSKYSAGLIKCPRLTKHTIEEFYDFLIHHLTTNQYDFLMPVGILSSYVCSLHQSILSKYVRLEVPPFDSFMTAIDKKRTFSFCERHDILHPVTNTHRLPLIIKSRGELWPDFPVKYIENVRSYQRELDSLKNIGVTLDEIVIQERIYGEPYGFFCLYQNGKCKKVLCQKRIREEPVTGGHATSATTVYDPKLIDAGKAIFDKLNWHGVGMAEFKKDNKGNYILIELNPKFWTAIELHIFAGMHFPHYLMGMDRELRYEDKYDKKTFVWLVAPKGELYRIFQKPSDIFKVIRDALKFKTDLHFDDFKPTIVQILYWVSWCLRGFKTNS